MSRPTLAQKQALARYRELQAQADRQRAAELCRSTKRDWSSTPADPAVQLYTPDNTDMRALNRLICILTLALFVFLAWAWFTPTGQLLLKVIRGAK